MLINKKVLELTRVASKMTRAMRSACANLKKSPSWRAQVTGTARLRFEGVSSVPPAGAAQNPRCRLGKRMRCIVWWVLRATFGVFVI